MIQTTGYEVPGRTIIEVLSVVQGNSVRARHVGRDIMAALKNLIGGEIKEYGLLQAETRGQATQRMVAYAEELGADAIIGLRYESSMIANEASEILAYGTAVKLEGPAK